MNSLEKDKLEILRKIDEKVIYTIIPVFVAVILIWITSSKVINSKNELHNIQTRMDSLKIELDNTKAKADTLDIKLTETISSISKIVSISHNIEDFIESKESFLRTLDEARFLINIRMLFDEIDSNFSEISELSTKIPELDRDRFWITIISSSKSLKDLKNEAKSWVDEYSNDQVAIYKSSNDYFALALKGDGSFTEAYRQTVKLQQSGKAYDAYFASSRDWDKNYLEQ
ncbi:MAG: hypothetical protein P8012_16985 [Desulfobacterales bacterium]